MSPCLFTVMCQQSGQKNSFFMAPHSFKSPEIFEPESHCQGPLTRPVFSLPLTGMVVLKLRSKQGPVAADSSEPPHLGKYLIRQGKRAGHSEKQVPHESEHPGQSFLMFPEREEILVTCPLPPSSGQRSRPHTPSSVHRARPGGFLRTERPPGPRASASFPRLHTHGLCFSPCIHSPWLFQPMQD